MKDIFRDFIKEAKAIRLKEPLTETLGAFSTEDAVVEYTFAEAVKMAGHACPTVTGAYLSCRKALEALYPDEEVPVRGEIAVTVYGNPEEGVYGVMAQVFSFFTGAAPATGFKGLGHKFKRKDLLRFDPEKIDPQAMCFEFKRLDNGNSVLVKFYPQQVPFPTEKGRRLGELMEKVLWEAARKEEKEEFQELWTAKVKGMLIEEKEIENWLKIEERRN
ncbi:MAG: FmdE family protein [Dehalococcoidales bacterium]|nr:FmdE family protein [Dehalococcoidales bacterium]